MRKLYRMENRMTREEKNIFYKKLEHILSHEEVRNMHDFYLYDWHLDRDTREGFHGFRHPKRALDNAMEHFDLDKKEANIISSHMWPLTFRKIPKNKEAFIVCMADKWCAVMETKESYVNKIKRLKYNS